MEAYEKIKQGERGAMLSIGVYIALACMKLIIGYAYHSEALSADGLNNSTDIVASLAVLIGLRISRKPPDRDHRYGHFRAETVAALIASFIMVVVGLQVLYQAVANFVRGSYEEPELITAWTALFCSIIMFVVYYYNSRLAKRIGSNAMMATAQDNRSDALVSLGAFVGIIGAKLGLAWLDPVAAFAVGLIICKTAIDIFRDATLALTDGFDDKTLKQFRSTIENTPGVCRVTDLKARIHGNNVLLDVTVEVAPSLNVAESHEITEQIEKRMIEEHQVEHVFIHIEPEEEGANQANGGA
ncbi:cation diffusion facilitator family transporter [Cohnella sp. AR92]|uniref:cation diffusion facilitator family transporter n=1 Tax=Cohnella sp. AR92 TaxID=648716 RepID=UPI000F8E3C5D|nr:cation diffusion facilitator family transporter [Cohnella sp. AR92]RUS47161.1 cation transporter [Cohnella sp. AR92]